VSEIRKLAAILTADVVGYSRLAGSDEDRTLARLRALRSDLIDPTIAVHAGRVVKRTGDGALVEFRSVVDAVRCAIEVQNGMVERNAGLPAERRIEFRIGIHVGDVVEESDGDLMGDGVNIAARLEGIAEPNGICLSAAAYEQVRDKLKEDFVDLGDKKLKNIARPVRAYRLSLSQNLAKFELVASGVSGGNLPLPDKPSIAVLPFQNMSGDKEQDFFGDGISEDIITALSKLRWLFVIARNSTFAYKGKSPDIRQVARELGVRYVLEGSVRKAGERLRITAQLIEAANGTHVWAERYDRAAAAIFAVQDEITESVVGSLEPQLYAAEGLRLQKRPTESLDAWGCVVRAMPTLSTWSAEESDLGIGLLKRALEIEPEYARATALLGWAYAARSQLGDVDPVPMLDKALALGRRARDQDDEDPWAHYVVGWVHTVARRSEQAQADLKSAIERHPNFHMAHMVLGLCYGYAGAADDGMRHVMLAMRLSPRDDTNRPAHLSTMGTCHFAAGRIAEALDCQHRAVELRPEFATAWRSLAAMAGLAGDLPLARLALAEALRMLPDLSLEWIERYYPMAHAGNRGLYAEGLKRAGLS
jgi:TolB-like protein/class 3 adenylate cyclase